MPEELQSLLEEMSLGQSGILDESSAQQVGKLLGAQALVFGSFIHNFDNKIRIDARMVEVETVLVLLFCCKEE